ncbi:MAG TPA: hypothetical protein VEK08_08170 [Planctomycetota bacterium]|nr:hypothetical protein [Planctomycetota bacterium]
MNQANQTISPPDADCLSSGTIVTEISPGVAKVVSLVFVVAIFSVASSQFVYELWMKQRPVVFDLFSQFPTRQHLRHYEEQLENASLHRKHCRLFLQQQLTQRLRFGNVHSIVGQDNWFYFMPGVSSVSGPGFLSRERQQLRIKHAADEGHGELFADPMAAIVQFHEQCANAGIRLVLLPIPDKASLQPQFLSTRAFLKAPFAPPVNPDYARLLQMLREKKIDVFSPLPEMISPDAQLRFLEQDTHWTPEWMDQVAKDLAAHIRPHLPAVPSAPALKIEEKRVSRLGDLVDMLRLAEPTRVFQPQSVTIQRIVNAETGKAWEATREADVLLLGDSFSNIFSAEIMGWGDAAGFAEHLSLHLQRPVDAILRNDAGAHATRQILSRELQSKPERLAGKKIIVWQFAARELSVGNWMPLEMKIQTTRSVTAQPEAGLPAGSTRVSGIVAEISEFPTPGTVTYKDHIFSLALKPVESADAKLNGKPLMVYLWSMRNNVQTPAVRLRPGQSVRLSVRPWSQVEATHGRVNRSELDDPIEPPYWGELEPQP